MTRAIRKVLIANRGEIAIRVARACRDQGISTVAVYSEEDRASAHVRACDEAYRLTGTSPGETYLDGEQILAIAERSHADTIHPGYGFLSESAEFAEAVTAANLTWVGPPASAIRALGDKVSARHVAEAAGAPQVPGTDEPVESAEQIIEFAREYGLPVAIKAAFGGGGRGLKVARTLEEIPDLLASATREALVAFGRGECFVEKFIDRPRHIETQCLADAHGTVAVISTRDCSVQRRHQKLIEEAPAPFLTDAQRAELTRASQEILRRAGYVGAGTCEFLLGADGTISFLEVNTRLQVEHPVSEEISGIDLVAEQLRVASGEALGYEDVVTRGHSIEFRINCEDPTRSFFPSPGTLTTAQWPDGPGVRTDVGYHSGDTIPGCFDSLIGKIIVTGATREQAIGRARRALGETVLRGIPTLLDFHRAIVHCPAFVDFTVYTTWIDNEGQELIQELAEGSAPGVPSAASAGAASESAAPGPGGGNAARGADTERIVVEVGGKRLEVVLPAGLGITKRATASRPFARRSARQARMGSDPDALISPMQGTIVKVEVAEGDVVEKGQTVVVLEAMKMEQPLSAPRSGVVAQLKAEIGQSVPTGEQICVINDPTGEA